MISVTLTLHCTVRSCMVHQVSHGVLPCAGCRAVMSYLQVVGEQHHQVETHMQAFSNRLQELCEKHHLLLPGAVEVRSADGETSLTDGQHTSVTRQRLCRARAGQAGRPERCWAKPWMSSAGSCPALGGGFDAVVVRAKSGVTCAAGRGGSAAAHQAGSKAGDTVVQQLQSGCPARPVLS